MTEQELRSNLHIILGGRYGGWQGTDTDAVFGKVVELFKQANYVRLADDQSLPEPIFSYEGILHPKVFSTTQEAMLKAGFRKVVIE